MLSRRRGFADRTALVVNVGGCALPLLFVTYLLAIVRGLALAPTLLTTLFVTAVAHLSKGRRFMSGVDHSAVFAPMTGVLTASSLVSPSA